MTKGSRNFWLDVVLFAAFALTTVSLFGVGSPLLITVHAVAGTLMALGTLVHLAWHWPWIKRNVLGTSRRLSDAARANRRINVPLFIFFSACTVTGLALVTMNLAGLNRLFVGLEAWARLHRMTGLLTFLLMVPHLGRHLKWLTTMARRRQAPASR